MICSSLCRVPFTPFSFPAKHVTSANPASVTSLVRENSHSRWSSFRGLCHPSIELFRELKQQEIDFVLSAARLRRFSSKSVMTHQGEPADQLLLLWSGRARYFFETANGKRVNLRWITPGHTFGEAALTFRPSAYLVSTEAVRESTALVWNSPTIRALAQRFPQLVENVFLTALDYLSWYIASHAALTSQTARERLAHVVLGY